MTDLYFIRHAQPFQGAPKFILKIIGVSSALSKAGCTQASITAKHLSLLPISRLFSSPVPRALETARLIASALDLNLDVRADLREQDWGRLHGLRPELIPRIFPDEWRKWQSGDPTYAPPGGETTRAFLTRVDRILTEMEAVNGISVAVTHFGFIQGVVCRTLGIPFRFRMPLEFSETSITHIRSLNGDRVLVSINDISHWQTFLPVK